MSYRPQAGQDAKANNAQMVDRILAMPIQPYQDGKYVLRVAEIVGRGSGTLYQVAIGMVRWNGAGYLVSPDPTRDWVRNLRASEHCAILAGAVREPYRAVAVSDAAEAIAVLRSYLPQLVWTPAQFPVAVTDSDDTMRANLDKVAVFRLDPVPAAADSIPA